jgi:hypothetical protein
MHIKERMKGERSPTSFNPLTTSGGGLALSHISHLSASGLLTYVHVAQLHYLLQHPFIDHPFVH